MYPDCDVTESEVPVNIKSEQSTSAHAGGLQQNKKKSVDQQVLELQQQTLAGVHHLVTVQQQVLETQQQLLQVKRAKLQLQQELVITKRVQMAKNGIVQGEDGSWMTVPKDEE